MKTKDNKNTEKTSYEGLSRLLTSGFTFKSYTDIDYLYLYPTKIDKNGNIVFGTK